MTRPTIQANDDVNLKWDASNFYTYPEEDYFRIELEDVSQLGVRRLRLPKAFHIPISNKFNVRVPLAFFPFKTQLTMMNDAGKVVKYPADTVVHIQYDNQLMRNRNLNAATLLNLQSALRPITEVTHDSIIASPIVRERVAQYTNDRPIYASAIYAWLTSYLSENPREAQILEALGLGTIDTGTLGGLEVTTANIEQASHPAILKLISMAKASSPTVLRSLSIMEFLSLVRLHPDSEAVFEHDAIADRYIQARANLMVRSVRPVQAVDALTSRCGGGILDDCAANVNFIFSDLTNPAAPVPVIVPITDNKIIGWFINFAFFSINYVLPKDLDVELRGNFALQRLYCAQYHYYHDSDELSEVVDPSDIVMPEEAVSFYLSQSKKMEQYCVYAYTTVISYLKAGHHATMFGIVNQLGKMLNAMQIEADTANLRDMVKVAVYYGAHCFSTRIMTYHLLRRAATEQISKAIAYRLNPVPPTYAAVCNLELFIDSLAAANFFVFTDKMAQYAAFKESMKVVRGKMHFAAPYSMYLYGVVEAEPTLERDHALTFAAYASAINEAMPGSTLGMSPALTKAAELANVNSIEARLLVSAYTAAFRRFFRGQIMARMGATRAAIDNE